MLVESEQITLLELARSSIHNGLIRSIPLKVVPLEYPAALQASRACFVTLTLEGALRGCIGHLEACQSLVEDVVENADNAAFKDPRFPMLTQQEYDRVEIHISVLSTPEPMPVSSQEDLLEKLRPGHDGIILQEGIHRGTFLPSVWEQLPTPELFIRQLKIKAGLPADYWSDGIEFLRYHTESIEE